MKVVILAGGMGTRISEESHLKPKPMIEIGHRPILWHIMKIYSSYGFNEFVICCGYKGYQIKEYFANYFLHNSDVTFGLRDNSVKIHNNTTENWSVTLVDTGDQTMTGGRLQKIKEYIGTEEFLMTYGDGVADVPIDEVLKLHRAEGRLATMTAAYAPARFGTFVAAGTEVTHFVEKPVGDGSFINGGFFVLSPKVFDLIENETTVWEQGPMTQLAQMKQLSAYFHRGFWHPMDTLRDKKHLEELWNSGKAPWKVWA